MPRNSKGFQRFQGLEDVLFNFKGFQSFQGPACTLSKGTDHILMWNVCPINTTKICDYELEALSSAHLMQLCINLHITILQHLTSECN